LEEEPGIRSGEDLAKDLESKSNVDQEKEMFSFYNN